MFGAFGREYGLPQPYTEADYFSEVDGKPRYDGVRSFLASRGVSLPEGAPDDPPDAMTVHGLGNAKQALFDAILARDGIEAYPGTVVLLDSLAGLDLPLAVVSSSRNAEAVLAAAGLADRFVFVMDGVVAGERGLPGKPAPDTFLAAAAEVGATAATSVVIEDAVSGVAAGRAGDFGRVIGVDRGAGTDALRAAGADLVVADLADLVDRADVVRSAGGAGPARESRA